MPTHERLTVLQQDLAEHVGTTGRPVVLIHHYHLENDSFGLLASFTDGESRAYWDVIEDYRVVAILTGHVHLSETTKGTSYPWWNRHQHPGFTILPDPPYVSFQECPPGALNSNIEFFRWAITGAARGTPPDRGTFMRFRMNGAQQLQIERVAVPVTGFPPAGNAVVKWTDTVDIGDSVYMAPPGSSPLQYGSADYRTRAWISWKQHCRPGGPQLIRT